MAAVCVLETKEALEQIFESPLAVLLKHSPRCPVSRGAKSAYMKCAESYKHQENFYIIDVITHRFLSREIEKRTGVKHESPQVLIVRNGTVAWTASHWNIREKTLKEAIGDS